MSAKAHLLLFIAFIGILALSAGSDSANYALNHGNKKLIPPGDSLKILKGLTGTWILDSVVYKSTHSAYYPDIKYKFTFFPNLSVETYKNNVFVKSSKWLVKKKKNNFVLVTEPAAGFLEGDIVLYNNILKLNDPDDSGITCFFSKRD